MEGPEKERISVDELATIAEQRGLFKMSEQVQLKTVELIWGNTVVVAIISVTIIGALSLAALMAGKMDSPTAEKIVIAIVSGVLGAAGGMTLSKLTK